MMSRLDVAARLQAAAEKRRERDRLKAQLAGEMRRSDQIWDADLKMRTFVRDNSIHMTEYPIITDPPPTKRFWQILFGSEQSSPT